MFFYLSKFIWTIIAPANALLFLTISILLALVFFKNKIRIHRVAMAFVVVLAGLFIFPIGNTALYAWESQYAPVTKLPEKIDGVIVLGGEIDPYISAERNQPTASPQTQRMYVLPELAKIYPNARLVYTGGSGYVRRQDKREADIARKMVRSWGVDDSRMVFERESRNTYENALFTKKIVKPKKSDTWLLVTSANHMPRSYAVFEKLGWNVTPYPVDYRAGKHVPLLCFCTADNLTKLQTVAHEIFGLAAYRLTGKAK